MWISVDGGVWEGVDTSEVADSMGPQPYEDRIPDAWKTFYETEIAVVGSDGRTPGLLGEVVVGVAGDTVFVSLVDPHGPDQDFASIRWVGAYQP